MGVPKKPILRVINRLEKLRIGNNYLVHKIEVYGSRVGSVIKRKNNPLKGYGPRPESDIDIVITVDYTKISDRNRRWYWGTLDKIRQDFEKTTGIGIDLHAPADLHSFKNGNLINTKFYTLYVRN